MDEPIVPHFMSRRTFAAAAGALCATAGRGAVAASTTDQDKLPPDTSNFGRCADDAPLLDAWKQGATQ